MIALRKVDGGGGGNRTSVPMEPPSIEPRSLALTLLPVAEGLAVAAPCALGALSVRSSGGCATQKRL